MHIELDPAYIPKKFEDKIYKKWEKSGSFIPKEILHDKISLANKSFAKAKHLLPRQKTFTISMPPPNATGILHLGHATMLALEDIMIRHHRMLGDLTLWIPGTDHAGIATQSVVEKNLQNEGIEIPPRTDP